MEILLTSDASGMLWNLCVWDFQTGTAIKSFKGGSSAPRSVCLLDGYFLISAAVGKPIIHVWAAQKKVVALVDMFVISSCMQCTSCSSCMCDDVHMC